ncbi:hypothetical protein FPV67DRAFT_1519702 [Lyophyllum atratum]|nr:hypothetical protein FPV67DRAFT_1519702 [Lyophyllum atratum]
MPSDSFNLFAALTVYYLVEKFLGYFVSVYLHRIDFRRALRASRKETVYFGMLLGAFISLSSFPFCANSLWKHTRLSPFAAHEPYGQPLSLSAEICITSRGVLWVSELNRLDLYPGYMYHHLGSLAMLLSAFYLNTLELLYIPFTTLVSGIPGDFMWILAAHQEMDVGFIGNQVWQGRKEKLRVINIWVYALMRIPSIPIIAYSAILFTRENDTIWSLKASRALLTWVFFVLLIYLGWVVAYLERQTQALSRREMKRGRELRRAGIPHSNGHGEKLPPSSGLCNGSSE